MNFESTNDALSPTTIQGRFRSGRQGHRRSYCRESGRCFLRLGRRPGGADSGPAPSELASWGATGIGSGRWSWAQGFRGRDPFNVAAERLEPLVSDGARLGDCGDHRGGGRGESSSIGVMALSSSCRGHHRNPRIGRLREARWRKRNRKALRRKPNPTAGRGIEAIGPFAFESTERAGGLREVGAEGERQASEAAVGPAAVVGALERAGGLRHAETV